MKAYNAFNEETDLSVICSELKKRINKLLLTYFTIITLTIVLFIALLAGGALGIYMMITEGDFLDFRIIFLIVMAIIVAGYCLGAVLSPLFNIMKSRRHNGREIHRKDYPELFEVIDEVVLKADSKFPKHVYVSDECNAYVFYSNLLGYISPKFQNLTIGLPLLLSLNKSELKAILSHEFGHFTQKSIAINRIANLSEFLCASISYAREEIAQADPDSEGYKASAIFFANLVNKIMYKQYENVAPLNAVLSRKHEFDADRFSYEIAGTEATVSALSKTQKFGERWANFLSYVEYKMKQNKIVPESLLSLFECYCSMCDKLEDIPVRPESIFKGLVAPFVSRLKPAIDVNTHPSDSDRCKAILDLPLICTEWNTSAATDYLKGNFDTYIHDTIIKEMMDKGPQTPFVKKQLTNEVMQDDMNQMVPAYVEMFFNDRIFYLQELNTFTDEEASIFEKHTPFTKENARLLEEFYVATSDYNLINQIMEENNPLRKFMYNGTVYDGQHAPMKEHREYCDSLLETVQVIVKHCNFWIRVKLGHESGHDVFLCAARTVSCLNDIWNAMGTVHAIYQQHDTSTKAMEFVDEVDAGIKHVFMNITQNMESFEILEKIFENTGASEKNKSRIMTYFKEGRKNLKEMLDIYELLYKIMQEYGNQAVSEIRSKYIWGK